MSKPIVDGLLAFGAWALCLWPLITWSPVRIGNPRTPGSGLAIDPGTGMWWGAIALLGGVAVFFTFRVIRNVRGGSKRHDW